MPYTLSTGLILSQQHYSTESPQMSTLYTKIDLAHAKSCLAMAQREFLKTPSASNWEKVTGRMTDYQLIWARLLEEKDSVKLWEIA